MAGDGALGGLTPLIDEWLDFKRSKEGGVAESSVQNYQGDLALIADMLGERLGRPELEAGTAEGGARWRQRSARIGPGDLTDANITFVLSAMNAQGLAPATRRRRIAALRGLCGYLLRTGRLDLDPMADVGNPRHTESLPTVLSDAELRRVFNVAEHPVTTGHGFWPARDISIARTLAGTGMRNSELCQLTLGSIDRDPDPMTVRVLGKGSKQRVVPISNQVVERIDAYLTERRARPGLGGDRPMDRIYVRTNGSPLDRYFIDRLVTRFFDEALVTVAPNEKAHRFRHTYAKKLIENGMTINQIQMLLGHADIKTTSIYLKLTADGVLDAAKLAPGAMLD